MTLDWLHRMGFLKHMPKDFSARWLKHFQVPYDYDPGRVSWQYYSDIGKSLETGLRTNDYTTGQTLRKEHGPNNCTPLIYIGIKYFHMEEQR